MTLTHPEDPLATEITVWHMAIESADELTGIPQPRIPVAIDIAIADKSVVSQRMYREVGAEWHWVDRLPWTDAQWTAWTERPQHHLLLARAIKGSEPGAVAGYIELEQHEGGHVEVAYFGLMPDFVGYGLGGWLLAEGLAYAWALEGTRRVTVHTCSLDSPAALSNYQARGFKIVGTESEFRLL